MLAAASRLHLLHIRTAFFPAITCLQLLDDFGGPKNWETTHHPLLDAALLFIPDFQLDCGPWGSLNPYQFGTLERLLKFRKDAGHQTVVGVQAPNKLSVTLKYLLLGCFRVQDVRPTVVSLSALTFAANSGSTAVSAEKECAAPLDDFFGKCALH